MQVLQAKVKLYNPSKKQNNRLCENVAEVSTQHSNAAEDNTVEDDSIINIRQTVIPSVTPDIPVTDRNESSHMEEHTHKKSTCTTSMIDATDQPCNYTKESERIQSTARALGRQSDVRKSDNPSCAEYLQRRIIDQQQG